MQISGCGEPPVGAQIPFNMGIEWSQPLPLTDKSGSSLVLQESVFGMTMYSYLLGISAVQSNVVFLEGAYNGGGGMFYTSGWEEEAGASAVNGAFSYGVQLTGPKYHIQLSTPVVFGLEAAHT